MPIYREMQRRVVELEAVQQRVAELEAEVQQLRAEQERRTEG